MFGKHKLKSLAPICVCERHRGTHTERKGKNYLNSNNCFAAPA